MSEYTRTRGFYFVFESNQKENAVNKLKKILNEEYGDEGFTSFTRMKYGRKSFVEFGGGHFEVSKDIYQNFLEIYVTNDKSLYSFYNPFLIDNGEEIENKYFYLKIFNFFERCCKELNPIAGYFDDSSIFWGEEPNFFGCKFEYYRDPYFFAIDKKYTLLSSLSNSTTSITKERSERVLNFLNDDKIKKELEEIKKILTQ